jgi:predicted nucleic acid-binding protein
LIYLDTSAFLKTVLAEPESAALGEYLAAFDSPRVVSSALLAVEARRIILRAEPAELPRVDLELLDVIQIDLTAIVLETASRLPDPVLRTLDAIHLATALLIRDDLEVLVSYDHRMLESAASHGLPVAAPA